MPNKYKKHKALVLLGLKTQDELDRDLTRFKASDLEGIKQTILSRIDEASVPTVYLLSLIPKEDYHQLPNCIVGSSDDFYLLEDLLKRHPEAKEVWAFPKERQASIGRFAVRDNSIDISQSQILEQVWSTNHRDIEHYDSTTKIPFISASRTRWKQRYNIDRIQNIPADKAEQYANLFYNCAVKIEEQRERIEEISDYFKSLGIESFAFEYRYDSRGFSFIDWDTNRDDLVLNNLFPPAKKYQKGIENDAR